MENLIYNKLLIRGYNVVVGVVEVIEKMMITLVLERILK